MLVNAIAEIGARGRGRTGTPFRTRDFKSLASTNFATRAGYWECGGAGRNRTGVYGVAVRCITTLPPRLKTCLMKQKTSVVPRFGESGAGNEVRTRDLNLGKVALYQLSYSRILVTPRFCVSGVAF